jgi:hypothetical protein
MSDTENDTAEPEDPEAQTDSLGFWQILSSTLAAAIGVQSSKNRERDFNRGKASQFIFMGVGFTVVLVLIMVGVVSLVLP